MFYRSARDIDADRSFQWASEVGQRAGMVELAWSAANFAAAVSEDADETADAQDGAEAAEDAAEGTEEAVAGAEEALERAREYERDRLK
ncbi:hypothetical protein Sste5344_001536 [Sporothrix stenoceras]